LTRRRWLAAALAPASCSKSAKTIGFRGFAFVANSDGQAVAVVDLTALALTRHVPLESNPSGVLTHSRWPGVFAVLPGQAAIREIGLDKLAAGRKVRLPGVPTLARFSPRGDAIWALCPEQKLLVRIAVGPMQVDARIQLPASPSNFAFAPDPSGEIAVSLGASGKLAIIRQGSVGSYDLGGELGEIVFRSDGQFLIVADVASRQAVFFDARQNRLAVRLPLAVTPRNFCLKQDGGQLYVTGEGADAVVNVFPYQTEVGAFMLAGKTSGPMAVSRDYLFVANTRSGDVSILDIQSQKMVAQSPVGREPCFIAVTPDNEFACVLNRDSGDMALLHIPTISARRNKSATLLTMIPVGSKPVNAVIRAAG
jgi:YVTN family beta-propeller protein